MATVIPVITRSFANLDSNATTLVINGFGFSSSNIIRFSNGVTGVISNATPTALTITFANPLPLGNLFAYVVTNGEFSASQPVAMVVAGSTAKPAVQIASGSNVPGSNFGSDLKPFDDDLMLFGVE